MRFAGLPCVLVSAGCFVDAIGSSDGGPGTGSSTSVYVDPNTSSSSTTGSAGAGGGEGGQGGAPGCVLDGELGPTEQCEDGNLDPGDGCDPTCRFEATCQNGAIEPGEPCDNGTVCDATCLGSCAMAPLAMPGPNVGDTVMGDAPSTFPSCELSSTDTNMDIYRVDLAPHPEGALVFLAEYGSPFNPVLWVMRSCGAQLFACDAVQPWETAFVDTGLLPPGSKLVVGAAAYYPQQTGGYQLFLWPYRFYDGFDADPRGWALTGWASSSGALWNWNTGGNSATSAPIYVGGVDPVVVTFGYHMSAIAGGTVEAAFDGGAFAPVETLSANPGGWTERLETALSVPRPAGAMFVKLRFAYLGAVEGFGLEYLHVGAAVPPPL